ncbi:MAG: amidohydrolase family protein [Gemmatimonadetes bacterium]|nr:amidohydrolase family protein [Gemmatimonadota bacterium]
MRPITLLLLAATAVATAGAQSAPPHDLLVRGGTVLDGSGRPRFAADVWVRGGHIAAVGAQAGASAKDTLDARGLFVAPGFVNLHSHAEPWGLPTAENMLSQGVTTEILNADGGGPLDIAAQLRTLQEAGLAVNAGAAIGFNAVWQSVVGRSDRRATAEEIGRMQQLVTDNLAAGAFAVSSGLDYKPGYFATEDEVVQVVSPARVWRTNFSNHDRLRPELEFSAREGVRETMRIGERAGLSPVITHMKVSGRERGEADVILGEMAALTRRGVYTAADVYPYLSGMTGLGALIIPGWAQDGGVEATRARFADPALRARIIAEGDATIAARFTGADGILVLDPGKPTRRLTEFMAEFGTDSPTAAIVKILETAMPAAILGFGDERDLRKLLQFPTSVVSCDCGATARPTGHPRNAGTFPRVLGRYVREQGVLTWEEAVRKMSGLPATIAGLVDRGYVAAGMAADLAVFDSATIMDHATYEQPELRSTGVRHVVVNGTVALRDGAATGARGGRALHRGSWMPTRPQDAVSAARSLRVSGSVVPVTGGAPTHRLAVSLAQAAGRRDATGTLTVADLATGVAWTGVTYGVVQRMGGWASVTGTVRRPGEAALRAFTLTVEEADPHVAGTPRTATLEVAGLPRVRGVVR